ncbi:hypothetical protein KFE25_006611 [Diacronema lutheri]|uniref:Uncharacterized protein n=1 Tax=Diacronema lutheri TaxID=2081491 RepID=A0A8J6C0U8_DIALT|nr:hypothetical protein KFE25_006611 [Diacronema lutheri]
MRAISAYIAPARGAALGAADGTVLSWRLSNAITEANAKFVSSAWHQDRCGRQLKLFVFTHDVDEERGRPTRVAAGSHPTFHYSSLYCVYTRYDDAWIRAWIRPPTGYGRAEADGAFARDVGGRKREAYVVDTNALHSATADGAFARDVVSLGQRRARRRRLGSDGGGGGARAERRKSARMDWAARETPD